MRSAIKFVSVSALALMLAPLGIAQTQGSSTSGSSTPAASGQTTSGQGAATQSSTPDSAQGSDGQYMPEKPEKNAPSPSTMNNIDAIGNRNVGCNKGMGNWYSLEKQVGNGPPYSQQVEHGAKMITDPVVTEYVNRIGQNLVRNSDAKVPFTIKVIDTDEINAFALPGGFFYVNSGLDSRSRQ